MKEIKSMEEKILVYRGKSKDVYNIPDGPLPVNTGCFYRYYGYIENGKVVFDPGYDTVVGSIPGKAL